MTQTPADRYFSNLPSLHTWDGSTWNSGGFDEWHLRELLTFIDTQIPNGARILETGAGNTTISFLLAGATEVVSIAPDEALFRRIVDYCESAGIDYTNLNAIYGPSELELPKLVSRGASFDFALIDGKHGWPAPFVDLCYSNYMVKTNGFIMIDDVQIKPCKEVASFLAMQPGYELVKSLQKAMIFKKTTTDKFIPDWEFQPYCVQSTHALPDEDKFSLYCPHAIRASIDAKDAAIDDAQREILRLQSELDAVLASKRYRLADRVANAYNKAIGR